ncbi:MAG TPA: Gfo/Idh/MocA family oxidoreductase [Alphaproteobacteria bacterium]|nr:Gfo/Idh/MocA family oxidoreductase [Alphaproteobacteria bacterium]
MRRRPLRGAFIGFGGVAAKGHLPGWRARSDTTIVAAADAAPQRRQAFLAASPGARVYESVDELLAGETLDFVDICTPPGSHAGLIAQALDARLHVLCEKPLTTRLEDARSVADAAARAERVVHTVHNWLAAPVCLRVSALVSEGAIGAVRTLRWRTLRSAPAAASDAAGNWRVDPAQAGGGILLDHGWHALYCIMRWASGTPRALSASLETRRFREWPLEDTATLAIDLATATGHVHLTWAADERANHIELEGERGSIAVVGESVLFEGPSGRSSWSCPPSLSDGSHHPDWFAGVAEDFHAAMAGDGAGNLAEALLCARLIDLAQRSSAAGGAKLPLEA